ncbi:MAG TPA: hypothetical protein EYQ50_14390 [Verrucomicrobiales bacterium]|nr:hypothetical protein [Verrucomicrobiales bacterium]HIL70295.1 hypothetical protein [Verrucomicrobiota bacterium]
MKIIRKIAARFLGLEHTLAGEASIFSRLTVFLGLITGILILLFGDVLLGLHTFFYRDFGIFGYPLAHFVKESYLNGEFPLWNPYNNFGIPFLAQWNTLALYPFSLFYILFPLAWALPVFCILHLIPAGAGAFLLARKWTRNGFAATFAGLAFALNGLTMSFLKWPNNISAWAWIPWVILLTECAWKQGGIYLLIAALFGALQMMTGAPEIILLTWLIVASNWLIQLIMRKQPPSKLVFRGISISAIIICLCGAQLFPFLQVLMNSQRDTGFSDATWSMPTWGTAGFFLPIFGMVPSYQGVMAQLDQYWISSYYPGIIVFFAAFWAALRIRSARTIWLVLIAAIGLWLSFGNQGGFYQWIRAVFPPIGMIRFPIKFIVMSIVAIPFLAAFALAKWDRDEDWEFSSILVPAGGFLAIILTLSILAFRFPILDSNPMSIFSNATGRIIVLGLFVALLFLSKRSKKPSQKTKIQAALLALLVLDSWFHLPNLNPRAASWIYDRELASQIHEFDEMPSIGKSRALLTPEVEERIDHLVIDSAEEEYLFSRKSLFCNSNLLDDIPKSDGFYSLYLPDHTKILGWIQSPTLSQIQGFLDFLSISHFSSWSSEKGLQWQERKNYLPWVTIGQRAENMTSAEIISKIASVDFDPTEVVFVEEEKTKEALPKRDPDATLTVKDFTNRRILIETKTGKPTMLVLSQSYHANWKALVNHKKTPILKVNGGFQAIRIPEGTASVQLVYQDLTFKSGMMISIMTLCLAFVFLARDFRIICAKLK